MGFYLIVAAIYFMFFYMVNTALDKPTKVPNLVLGALVWPLTVVLLTVLGFLILVGLKADALEIVDKNDD